MLKMCLAPIQCAKNVSLAQKHAQGQSQNVETHIQLKPKFPF